MWRRFPTPASRVSRAGLRELEGRPCFLPAQLSFPRHLGLGTSSNGDWVGLCSQHQPDCPPTAFKPIDLSDLKRRNTQDAKKS